MEPSEIDRPAVSVLMITYRHEGFIAQAIESVLMQRTDFRYELVIGEDKSPDGTLEIIERYQALHPEKIRVYARNPNLGMMRNLVETFSECRGRYVALLEGDDYWTDPDKLQIQFDAMERHRDWALCFHRARYVSHDSSQVLGRGFDDIPPETTLDDLLEKYYMTTLSILFRRDLVDRFPPWYVSLPMGDWPLTILLARHGKIGYIERTMGDYRIHPGGMYSGASTRQRLDADATMYRHIRPLLDPERASTVTRHIIRLSASVIACDVAAHDYAAARTGVLALYRSERWLPVTVSLLRGAARRLTRPLVHKARGLMPRSVQRAVEGPTR